MASIREKQCSSVIFPNKPSTGPFKPSGSFAFIEKFMIHTEITKFASWFAFQCLGTCQTHRKDTPCCPGDYCPRKGNLGHGSAPGAGKLASGPVAGWPSSRLHLSQRLSTVHSAYSLSQWPGDRSSQKSPSQRKRGRSAAGILTLLESHEG